MRRTLLVEPDCKENKSFKLTNSNNLRSVICPGRDPSVSVTLFYRFCLQTVIRARGDDRQRKEKNTEFDGVCVCPRRNSLTSPTAPFPLTLPLPVVHQHFLNTLSSKSCFVDSGLLTRPPSKTVSNKQSEIHSSKSSGHSCLLSLLICLPAYSLPVSKSFPLSPPLSLPV